MSHRGRGGPHRGARGAHGFETRARQRSTSRDPSPSSHVQKLGKHHINSVAGSKNALVELAVRGWTNTKAAGSADGGLSKLNDFLEKKASSTSRPAKITKSRLDGDTYIISVRSDLQDRFLHLNSFTFVGAPLTITKCAPDSPQAMVISPTGPGTAGMPFGQLNALGHRPFGPPQPATDTRAYLKEALRKRYNMELKLLDLSALKADAEFQQLGVFGNPTLEAKFFPVLMKLCDDTWDTPTKKEAAVQSIVVSNNQLASVLDITTLAATFPSLKNLDLSNNLISNFEGLKYWRWKFRELEHLVLTNNPIDGLADFQATILKWFPKLLRLNGVVVRTPQDVRKAQDPMPSQSPYLRDEANICAKFLTSFIPLFDTDRTTALRNFYDASSHFSVSVNTQAKRARDQGSYHTDWEDHIRRSRNLLKITHHSARRSRMYRGAEIQKTWEQLPRTKHPSLTERPTEWLVECHPIPGLPDPQNQSRTGVGGLIIMLHGSFEELHSQPGKAASRRSFDRTFVLGPSATAGGIRVVSDILVLRDFGGSDAWLLSESNRLASEPTTAASAHASSSIFSPTSGNHPIAAKGPSNVPQPTTVPSTANATITPTPTTLPNQPHPEIPPGSTLGQATADKSDMQLQQELMAINLSFKTGMKLQWAAMCLAENSWDPNNALSNFQNLLATNKAAIPPDAFLSST